MSAPGTDRQAEDRLLEEAAEWFARMRGPDEQSARAGFEAWLGLGEAQRSAYNRASEIFAMGKLLGEDGTRPGAVEKKSGKRRLPAFASLGLLVLAAATAWFLVADDQRHRSKDGVEVALLTAPAGEQRLVRLSDGSLVRLGGATRIAVRFAGDRRSLTLDRGAARFEVAHEARPFIVLAGGGSVTAHGTIFEVELAADRRVSVRLLQGSVDVRLPQTGRRGPTPVVRRLRPGEGVSFASLEPAGSTLSGGEGTAAPDGPSPGTPAAQASDYDSIRLADLVAAANSGALRPILLADARTGERRVSGHFRIDDTTLLAERLALLFNLEIDRSNPSAILLKMR